MNIEIALDVPAGPRAAVSARRSLEGLRAYVGRQAYDDVRLLVSELVSNSTQHAGLSEGTPIRVCIQTDQESIHTEVTDPGRGFGSEGGSTEQSGYGLRLVERMAQRWGVKRRGGTTVWFELGASDGEEDEGPATDGTSRQQA
jgi:two-component sensor histidine kinase